MHGTREYGHGDGCVVGEFVLAYLSYFTDFLRFWQVVVHTYVNFIHTFIRGHVKLWINATPICLLETAKCASGCGKLFHAV